MNSDSFMKSIIRDYDRKKFRARELYNLRLSEIYKKLPRVKEIDDEISSAGLKITKAILNDSSDRDSLVAGLRESNNRLFDEKDRILISADIPCNYLTDIYECKACKDTGFIGSSKCNCLKNAIISKQYQNSNLSFLSKDETFNNFDLRYYSNNVDPSTGITPRINMKKIYGICMEFVDRFGTGFENILMRGDTGLGKTFLCSCIANELIGRGFSVIYLSASQLFKRIEDHRFNRTEEDVNDETLNLIYDVDLLILDDLGTEFLTILTSTELFNIINIRYQSRKPVIISTNLGHEAFVEHYTERIASRVHGTYTNLYFFGEDIRMKKRYNL